MIFLADIKKGSRNEEFQNCIKEKWSSNEIISAVAKLDEKLRALGFEQASGGNCTQRVYARRSDVKDVYVGTFVNKFSLKDEVPLWSDHYLNSYKYIVIGEVYRHNGTSQNANLQISVVHTPKYNAPTYYKDKDGFEWVSTGGIIKCERVKKFSPDASDKILEKLVKTTVEKLDAILLEDYTQYAKNRADYHEDTSEENYQWKKNHK